MAAKSSKALQLSPPNLAGWELVPSQELPSGTEWMLVETGLGFLRGCICCTHEPTHLSDDGYAMALRRAQEQEPLATWTGLGQVTNGSFRWSLALLHGVDDLPVWTAQASTVVQGYGIVLSVVLPQRADHKELSLLSQVLQEIEVDHLHDRVVRSDLDDAPPSTSLADGTARPSNPSS